MLLMRGGVVVITDTTPRHVGAHRPNTECCCHSTCLCLVSLPMPTVPVFCASVHTGLQVSHLALRISVVVFFRVVLIDLYL